MNDLLILAYADEGYDKFVLPYIYYALKSNPAAQVEIILDEYTEYEKLNKEGMDLLHKIFPNKFWLKTT